MLLNVTDTTADHQCSHVDTNTRRRCTAQSLGIEHSAIAAVMAMDPRIDRNGNPVLVLTCPGGHEEHFNMELAAEDEVSGSLTHQQQSKFIRQLMTSLGLRSK